MGLPGGKSSFTPLDMAMSGTSSTIYLTPTLHQAVEDWKVLIGHLKHHPTSALQISKSPPHYISYTDASGLGAGGV